ncbi:MAG TPA: hypothetical protein VLF94_04305 [Chlamydiales bacterium]|nr:hypothetical protein [Chlamydiales bacterium]
MAIDGIDELEVGVKNTFSTPANEDSKVALNRRGDEAGIRKTMSLSEQFFSTLSQPNARQTLRDTITETKKTMRAISTDGRSEINKLKKEYQGTYQLSGRLGKELANNSLAYSIVGFATSALGLTGNSFDKFVGDGLSNTVPHFGKWMGSNKEEEMAKANALNGLLLQEYSQKTSQATSEANSLRELDDVVTQSNDDVKQASRSGG